MADKKITIKPSDMERLRELMRREEAKFDAANPSEAELEAMEADLEQSIRQLAKKTPGQLPSVDQEMERNWNAVQQKLKADAPQKVADVLPLQAKKTNKALPWIGIVAAAALVMIMIRPSGQQDDRDPGHLVTKNTSGEVSKTDCQVNAIGPDVTPMDDGMGFAGPADTLVQVSIKCGQTGFLHARFSGPGEPLQFSFEVTKPHEPALFLQNGKVAEFTLQSARPWVMSLVFADQDFKDHPVPEDHILWKDPEIRLGAR